MAARIPHLVQRYHVWFARLQVPKDVQEALGLKVLIRTTGTRDLVRAVGIAQPILREWKACIQGARVGDKAALDQRFRDLAKAFRAANARGDVPAAEEA